MTVVGKKYKIHLRRVLKKVLKTQKDNIVEKISAIYTYFSHYLSIFIDVSDTVSTWTKSVMELI